MPHAASRSARAERRALALALSSCLLLGACSALHSSPPRPSPSKTVSAYLSDWASRSWGALAGLVIAPPADFAQQNADALTTLGARSERYDATSTTEHGDDATANVLEHLDLAVVGHWTVSTELHLRLVHNRWRVVWSPATINPALGARGHYTVSYDWPPRAPILAADGSVISTTPPTSVVIGIEGYAVEHPTSLTASLVAAGATESEVAAALEAADASPDSFEPVFTVDWGRYVQLRPTLYPIPGVFFQSEGGSGSTPPDLVGVVGSLGAITKADLERLGPPYDATSVVGQSGLEQSFQAQLAGTPGMTISAVDATGSPNTAGSTVVKTFPPVAGKPVRTTIEPAVEQDAANALADAPNEAALVAIDASTGQIVAVANTSQGSDLALQGEQPPGSTMKVITSTALIHDGLTPDSPATCPPVINVDGENLHNAGDEGPVSTMLQAFTVSCNTAYIGLTMANLNDNSLHDAALEYRIGTHLRVGLTTFGGSVPVNDGQTDLAASAIGQARVVMSPLDLAMAAADIDTGTVRTPFITAEAPAASAPTGTLPANLVSDLHEMMLSVVESGTAAGTGLPAGTYAKTGTAEYGTGNPLPIDAWLMGFNGNIAFAMVDIDAPADGGPTDGPIVAKFLDSVGSLG